MSDKNKALPVSRISRRQFVRQAVRGSLALGATAYVATRVTAAQASPVNALGAPASKDTTQKCTDSDGGAYQDPVGYGRRCASGCTDSDTGAYSDPVGDGYCVDSDIGCNADP